MFGNWLGIIYPWEVVSYCFGITCFAFFLSSTTPFHIKLFLSQPTSFLAFTFPFLFPHPPGNGVSGGNRVRMLLSCLPGLIDNSGLILNPLQEIVQLSSSTHQQAQILQGTLYTTSLPLPKSKAFCISSGTIKLRKHIQDNHI